MISSAISRRYAKALLELGAEQRMVERYAEELEKFSSLLARQDFLRQILESPTYPQGKKAAILADLTKSLGTSQGMKNFLGLLLEKDRLQHLSQIEEKYREFADDLAGVVRARIVSAAELGKSQRKEIQSGLEKQTGKKIELKVETDPSLVGGIKAEIGGKVFDGSVRTQLKRIEDTLKKG